MRRINYLFAFFLTCFLGACASYGELSSTESSSPIIGSWDYTVESPDGIFSGKFMISEGEYGLSLLFTSEEEDTDPVQAEAVQFDSETQMLTFEFDNQDYGRMEVSLALHEGGMNGMLHSVQFGVDAPLTATRADQ